MILTRAFFMRPTPLVARELLGMRLVRRLADGTRIEALITETEAYEGFHDRASHAHRGPTARNRVMFGPGGYAYVYLCYGLHWMLNLTTRESGVPAAVLVRGTTAAGGPGRVTRHFRIDGADNALPLRPASGIWVATGPARPSGCEIGTAPRVGVEYAGPEWSAKPWRFTWFKD